MAVVTLDTVQRNRLVALLAERVGLTPLQRETMLEAAGLDAVRTSLTFDADARGFAAQLVRQLQKQGTLPETRQPALVSLLRWLRDEVVGHEADAAFVDGLLASYVGGAGAAPSAAPSAAEPPLPPRATVRELVMAAFSEGDLSTFCFDHFREVYDDFTGGMARSERVLRLVEHCERRGETRRLLDLVREANPYQFGRLIG